MKRTSIEIPTLSHLTPIPVASRIGPLIESSIIMPFNPGTRDVPPGPHEQINNLFAHVGSILDAAGASWDDVVKVTFFTDDPSAMRDALSVQWLDKFPDPRSRPARHTAYSPTTGEARVSCVFTAYLRQDDAR